MDFGRAEKLDLIEVVRRKYKCSRMEASNRIAQDVDQFGQVEIKQEAPPVFDANVGEMDYSYWNSYRIPEEVVDRYTFLARTVYRNESYWGRSTAGNPIFIYPFTSGRMKIYRPKSPDSTKKWAGNSTAEDVGGLAQLPKKGRLLIITSSIKDVMVLKQHGFPAICFNGEGYGCDPSSSSFDVVKSTIKGLKRRFEKIVLLLDSDEVGKANSAKFSLHHKIPTTFIGPQKDPSDFQRKHGVRKTFRVLKQLMSKSLRHES